MMDRFLLTRFGCEDCREFLRAVQKINPKLQIEKRIRVIDCKDWEHYGVQLEPIMRKFEKDGLADEGYPFCYISGIIVQVADTKILYRYLLKLLEEDLIN